MLHLFKTGVDKCNTDRV